MSQTTDIVLFRQHRLTTTGELQVLLIQRGGDPTEEFYGYWATPGGHIDPEDCFDFEVAAARELQEETGISCEQVPYPLHLRYMGAREEPGWVGHVFWGLVTDHHDVSGAQAADDAQDLAWVNYPAFMQLKQRGQMAFDHAEVVENLFRLVSQTLNYQ